MITVGTGFIGIVSWVAVRIVARLDRLSDLLQDDIRTLLHDQDKRITKLENWYDSVGGVR
jgi:hypothetical protein